MFTNTDYKDYFNELEGILKKTLIIYTDLLNELSDQSIRSKMYSIIVEDTEAFKTIKKYKENFS